MTADDMTQPQTAVVRSVEGRGTPGSARGLPPAARMVMDGPFGIMEVGLPKPRGLKVPGTFKAVVDGGQFTACPICLSLEADSAEHIPPLSLGGKVMTTTCKRCNNGFGSRVEKSLADLYFRSVDVRVSSHLLPGNRKMPQFLLRETEDGVPVFLQGRGKADAELGAIFHEVMQSGAEFKFSLPDPRAVRIAALKSAYLGACLAIREVPMEGAAAEIRAELLAARDAPRRAQLPLGPRGAELMFALTGMDPIDQPVTIVDWVAPKGGTITHMLLGGAISVGWPLEEEWLEAAIQIGARRDDDILAARRRKAGTSDGQVEADASMCAKVSDSASPRRPLGGSHS